MTRKLHHKISHLDKPDIIVANEWTSQIKIPNLCKRKLKKFIQYLSKEIEYIPTLDELIYPNCSR